MLRNVVSKTLLPSFERDLNRWLGKEIASMEVNCMIAPQVFGYKAPTAAGAFRGTTLKSAPNRLVKVEYPCPKRGLFSE